MSVTAATVRARLEEAVGKRGRRDGADAGDETGLAGEEVVG